MLFCIGLNGKTCPEPATASFLLRRAPEESPGRRLYRLKGARTDTGENQACS